MSCSSFMTEFSWLFTCPSSKDWLCARPQFSRLGVEQWEKQGPTSMEGTAYWVGQKVHSGGFHMKLWKSWNELLGQPSTSTRRRPLIPEFGPSVLHVGPQLWFDLSASPLGQAHWDSRTMSCSTPPPQRSQASLVNSHDRHLYSTDYVSGAKG